MMARAARREPTIRELDQRLTNVERELAQVVSALADAEVVVLAVVRSCLLLQQRLGLLQFQRVESPAEQTGARRSWACCRLAILCEGDRPSDALARGFGPT
jgi:hypothetical protein